MPNINLPSKLYHGREISEEYLRQPRQFRKEWTLAPRVSITESEEQREIIGRSSSSHFFG